jgi:ribose 5-phosphate isomerase B
MRVAVGFDHAGFALRGAVIGAVGGAGHEVIDLGTDTAEPVDFPEYSWKVGRTIQTGAAERGILVCGSGVGACIAANKMRGVYASVCHDEYSAAQGVEHDDMNVLCLGARVVDADLSARLVSSFLGAHFLGAAPGGERFARRVAQIRDIENAPENINDHGGN